MDLGLSGKRALITGASRGIGAAVARTMAGEGANLVLVARNGDHLNALKAEIEAEHGQVSVDLIVMDMRQPDACRQIAEDAGDVDILINNAGDVPTGTLVELDEETWRHAWDLKIFGYINLTREIYARMAAKGYGVIVNVVGSAAERPRAANIAVASGNGALVALSRGLGADSPKDGIRVLAVNPGATETDRQIDRWKAKAASNFGDETRWPELTKHHPFGRMARAEEVASVVTFMASSQASYVSGTTVTVDGGGVLTS